MTTSASARTRRAVILAVLLAAVLALPLLGEPYYVKVATRMAVFGIVALSLDLLVGYTGLISFGHAAFLGVGAYTVGILASHGVHSAWIAWPLAMAAAAAAATVIGAISLRSTGLYFIFITLAFNQMLYYLAQSLRQYGGDDGFALARANAFIGGVDAGNPVVLFYVSMGLLLGALYAAHRMVHSRFGQVAQAARDNELRLAAVGVAPYRYKLSMFIISGALAGLGGALNANLMQFVSPSLLSWTVSGDLLMMVILGSVGTLIGPVLGAVLFIGFEQVLSDLTEHWMLILGPILVARVLFLKDGIYGFLGASRVPVAAPAGGAATDALTRGSRP